MRLTFAKPDPALPWLACRPGRFASTIQGEADGCQIALLGLPDDLGVRLNGGRPGAQLGPSAFRQALASFGSSFDGLRERALDVRVFDAGDVAPATGDAEQVLFETHARVEATVLELHKAGLVPVCIGGGHDLSLPSITALAKHQGARVGGINLDAHLDVRERVGSGMPFRRLISDGRLDPKRFVEFGLGRFANDAGDVGWLRAQGASLIYTDEVFDVGAPPSELFALAFTDGPGFVSIDLDGLDQSVAPGVSAMNPCGLGVGEAAALAEAAGSDHRVRHFDLMELCPPHDEGGRTARVAAFLFLRFLAGFCARKSAAEANSA